MSDYQSASLQENATPAANPYDGTSEAYESHDSAQSIESAMDEKIQTDQLRQQVQNLEEQEGQNKQQEQSSKSSDDEFSSKFAALSRREKALREREAQIDSKLLELEERFNQLQQPQEPQVEPEPELPLEYRLKKDPLNTLKDLGLSYEQLTNLALNDGKLTPEMQMDLLRQEIDQKYSSEIEKLKQELEERDKRLEEEKYNEVVNNFKTELTNFVNDSEKYELIRANDASDLVYDVIEQHYGETGRILSKEEAADAVEEYLEEELEKLLKVGKVKNKLTPQEAAQQAASPKPTMTQKAPTLSNAHSAAASKPSRPLTREESVARAASLLKWNE